MIAMTPDQLFQAASNIALLGWILLLVISPFWTGTTKLVSGILVLLLAGTYAWLIFQSFSPADMQKFGSLDGVLSLFTNKEMVAAGWIHYLAFDLFIGTWIVNNAREHAINHWLTIPCLLLTFMLGPCGWLLYMLLRWAITKNYFAEN